MSDIPTTPLTDEVVYPEGPRWHDGLLWYSDMLAGTVRTADESGVVRTVAEIGGRPSGLGFLPDGTPLVVSMFERRIYRIERDGPVPSVDLSAHIPHACNDMIVDARGRAYVGNFGFDLFGGEEAKPTSLLLVDPDGSVRVVAEDLVFPNGMAITADGATFYIAETFMHRITAFDIAEDGTLSNRRVHGDLGERTPDGTCLDGENNVWFASALEGEYARLLPDGRVDTVISARPGRIVPAVALGGADGRTLFLLQAETDIPGIGRGESSGFIETARVEIPRGHTIP